MKRKWLYENDKKNKRGEKETMKRVR